MTKPLIIFDWDGTLADSMALCIREVSLALERTGLPLRTEEEIRACNGPTHLEALDVLHIPQEKREAFGQARLQAEMESIPQVLTLYPGIADLLHTLQPIATVVIASNGVFPYVDAGSKATGVHDCFHRIEASKPGRTKAQAIAEMLEDYQPTKAAMVGDRLNDFLSGRANQLPTVACTYGYGTPEEYAIADYQVSSVSELSTWLHHFINE